MKIGFIGLGNMGAPMARNLMKAGHELTVFDVSAAALADIKEMGASISTSVAQLAKVADLEIIITMLPAAQHVRSVYLGSEGILENISQGVVLIDSSTIDPQTSREVASLASIQGNPMLDAPVSGGTGGAQAGTLTFMVGGHASDFARVKPVLENMGKNIVHCGGSGNGQVAKVANNMLLGISMIATSEAMNLGVALGMDPKVLAGIINTSSGRCWSSEVYNPYPGVVDTAPASRGYTGGFGVDLMLKDLGLATQAAKGSEQEVVMGELARQIYQKFSMQGNGGLDFSAIIQLQNK